MAKKWKGEGKNQSVEVALTHGAMRMHALSSSETTCGTISFCALSVYCFMQELVYRQFVRARLGDTAENEKSDKG